ncbi:MAG: hypothetical protein LC721_02825, partial [Actinobacteria bacterium]|nr:hypothetical protein [Actinomycetota bacterium]
MNTGLNTVGLTQPAVPGIGLPFGTSHGEDEELSVMRALWDYYDTSWAGPNSDHVVDLGMDRLGYGFQGLFNIIKGLVPTGPAGPPTAPIGSGAG